MIMSGDVLFTVLIAGTIQRCSVVMGTGNSEADDETDFVE